MSKENHEWRREFFWRCWAPEFSREEFACPCCGRENMEPTLMTRLYLARKMAGVPFVITSGCRCEKHNRAAGGKPASAHVKGRAVDIAAPDSRARFQILRALTAACFTRMGIGEDFIHADRDPDKPQNLIWVY